MVKLYLDQALREYNRLLAELAGQGAEIERLRFKLQRAEMESVCAKREAAASQARQEQLRDELFAVLVQDMSGDKARLKVEEFKSDTSALEALISRASEVMRERCAEKIESQHTWVTSAAASTLIRAVPGLKLEDLK